MRLVAVAAGKSRIRRGRRSRIERLTQAARTPDAPKKLWAKACRIHDPSPKMLTTHAHSAGDLRNRFEPQEAALRKHGSHTLLPPQGVCGGKKLGLGNRAVHTAKEQRDIDLCIAKAAQVASAKQRPRSTRAKAHAVEIRIATAAQAGLRHRADETCGATLGQVDNQVDAAIGKYGERRNSLATVTPVTLHKDA